MKKQICMLVACALLPLNIAAKVALSTPPVTPEIGQLLEAINEQTGDCQYVNKIREIRVQPTAALATEEAKKLFENVITAYESQIDDSKPEQARYTKELVLKIQRLQFLHNRLADTLAKQKDPMGRLFAMEDFASSYASGLKNLKQYIAKQPYAHALNFLMYEVVNHKYVVGSKDTSLAQLAEDLEENYCKGKTTPTWVEDHNTLFNDMTVGPLSCVE